MVKSNIKISGLKLPGTSETMEISQFADDNSLVCVNYSSIFEVFNIVDDFCKASGAQLNKDKCKGLWMGSWRHNKDQLCRIKWGNSLEEVVGVQIGNDDYIKANWETVLKKFEKVLSEYQHWILSMKGKAIIANTLALSKIFLCQIIDIYAKGILEMLQFNLI